MGTKYKRQSTSRVDLTVSGTTASGTLSPELIGVAPAVFVKHTGSGFDLTITDADGYDILQGLGTGITANTQFNASQISGNPCQGQPTANISGGTNTETAEVIVYIKGPVQTPRAMA